VNSCCQPRSFVLVLCFDGTCGRSSAKAEKKDIAWGMSRIDISFAWHSVLEPVTKGMKPQLCFLKENHVLVTRKEK